MKKNRKVIVLMDEASLKGLINKSNKAGVGKGTYLRQLLLKDLCIGRNLEAYYG